MPKKAKKNVNAKRKGARRTPLARVDDNITDSDEDDDGATSAPPDAVPDRAESGCGGGACDLTTRDGDGGARDGARDDDGASRADGAPSADGAQNVGDSALAMMAQVRMSSSRLKMRRARDAVRLRRACTARARAPKSRRPLCAI